MEFETETNFITAFKTVAKAAYQNSKNHGFWENAKDRNQAECIALMHSELSECLEGIRHGNPPDHHCPEFSSVEIELADVCIRLMDFAAGFGYDVASAVIAKMRFNATRPAKHGKAF